MARSIECQCTYNFTCGHCLRNAKPYFFTLSDGSAVYVVPEQGKHQTELDTADRAQEGK